MVRSSWEVLAKRLPSSVQDVIEILMENRGVGPSFMNGSLRDLEEYLLIRGLNEGAELMSRHLSAGHKVVLVGDYDCDGVTSVAQLSHFLRDIGYRDYEVVIPNRAEGYGIPQRAVEDHRDAELFVAVDCGTLDIKAVSMVREMGADCIVIDHHEVPEGDLAPATVLINPKHPSCPSAFKEFCSSGLTLLFLAKLRRALDGRFPSPGLGSKYLILATIGTVADIVPLVEANRILTRNGLYQISKGDYPSVKRIIDMAGLGGKTITAGHIGYYIGPRINAAGRMADARVAFDLLMAEHSEEIQRLAHELNRLNARRQYEEDVILSDIRQRFVDFESGRRTVVMGDPQWPAGIIGIIASRIQQELHYGPVIVFSMDPDQGIARGSARSIPGFDIHAALKSCDDLLMKWGGHKMAAGMTIDLDRMEAFAERFESVAREHAAEVFVPKGKVDMELELGLVTTELLNDLRQLEPHGLGNPTPTFAARRVSIRVQKAFGRDQNHLRLVLNDSLNGVFWRGLNHYQSAPWDEGSPLDVVFQVERDTFCNRPTVTVKDIGNFF